MAVDYYFGICGELYVFLLLLPLSNYTTSHGIVFSAVNMNQIAQLKITTKYYV